MSELDSGGIPLSTELVAAEDIRVGNRIIRYPRIEEVIRIKHMNDNTLELRVFSESRGYENILFSPWGKIFKVIEEGPST